MSETELAAMVLLTIMVLVAAAGTLLIILLWGQRRRPRFATPAPQRRPPLAGVSMMHRQPGPGARYLSLSPSAVVRDTSHGPPTPQRQALVRRAARLQVQRGPLRGSRYDLSQPSLALGRSLACDIPLPDPQASRQHARLEWGVDGLVLVDTDSTNGTYVDGRRITRMRLRGGERIQIGQTTFVIHAG